MQLLAEENIINNIINTINHSFILKPNLKVTIISGKQLKQIPTGQTILTNSLNDVKTKFNLPIGKNYKNIVDDRLYITIFQPAGNEKNLVQLIVPFSANTASLLIGALVDRAKDQTWTEQDIMTNLDRIKQQAINDVVVYQLFKFYTPDKTKVPTIPEKILNKISYKGFDNDSFNMEILFELPIDDVYQPLKTQIKTHASNTDYNKFSLAPIKLISYDENKKLVQLITSLY